MAIRKLSIGAADIGGGAKFSMSAPSAFAKRGLSQCLAREFGPKGVHVAHVVLDGMINTDRVQGMMGQMEEGIVRLPGRWLIAAYGAQGHCSGLSHLVSTDDRSLCRSPISRDRHGRTSSIFGESSPSKLTAGRTRKIGDGQPSGG